MYQIKSRFSDKVLFEMECTSFRICVEAAVRSRADLYGANLYGADGKKTTIQKTPIQISGLRWLITIFDKDMQIGCEYHSLADWWSYDNDRISDMGSHALGFWKQHKGTLQDVCKATGRTIS